MIAIDWAKAVVTWLVVIIVRLAFTIIGLVVIPFAVPRFAYTGEWRLLRLAFWALPWDNARDGILGDRRLHYWERGDQFPKCLDGRNFLKAYYWLAIRNPTNYLSRHVMGCDLRDYNIRTVFQSDYAWMNAAGDFWYGFGYNRFGWDFFIGFKLLDKYIGAFNAESDDKAIKGFTLRLRRVEK